VPLVLAARHPARLRQRPPLSRSLQVRPNQAAVRDRRALTISSSAPLRPAPLVPPPASTMPSASGLRASSPAPTSRGQLRAFVDLMRQDKDYARGYTMIALNQLGDGLVAGGFFMLLNELGIVTHSLSVACMVSMNVVEVGLGICGQVYAALQRDQARHTMQHTASPTLPRAACGRQLFLTGILDFVCAASLLGGAVGTAFLGLPTAALFVLLTVVRGVQSLNTSYEMGAWYCMRTYMGSERRAEQADILCSVNGLEMALGSTLFTVGQWGTCMGALGLAAVLPGLLLPACVGTLAVGGLLASLPKIYFLKYARGAAEQAQPA
jgi:hypothetical protein